MREFFRGRRRKVGVVTLIVACLFSAGLVRSLDTWDVIAIEAPWDTRIAIESGKQFCELSSGPGECDFPIVEWDEFALDGVVSLDEYLRSVPSQSRFRGFGIAIKVSDKSRYAAMAFSYWDAIIPPTLISTWMLLSKPRVAAPMKTNVTKLVEAL